MRLPWVFAICLCGAAFGQSFEVASVKPSDPRQSAVDFVISPGGRLRVTNLTLADMIREAYRVKHYQIFGGPAWMQTARFHVDAKAAGEPTRDQMLDMLRTLLEERFQLRARRETREGSIFELVVAKGGPKLTASKAETAYLRLYRNTPPELPGVSYTIGAQKVGMARLADDLTGSMGHPVLDRTGLDGEFDFKIDYAVEGHAEVGPSMFTALQEQLGLRLQAAKGPVDTVVIEKAERPTEN